jgi:hypothetical protein
MVEAQTLLVFVGIPLLVIAVVSLLVYAPAIAKGPRYRPGLSWWAPPVWIGGPSEELEQSEQTGAPALPPGKTAPATAVARTTGGASASW